jgi:hypothetical protein
MLQTGPAPRTGFRCSPAVPLLVHAASTSTEDGRSHRGLWRLIRPPQRHNRPLLQPAPRRGVPAACKSSPGGWASSDQEVIWLKAWQPGRRAEASATRRWRCGHSLCVQGIGDRPKLVSRFSPLAASAPFSPGSLRALAQQAATAGVRIGGLVRLGCCT